MKKDFWSELDERLSENSRLSQGGVPSFFKPWATFLGLYPWQSLLTLSSLITLGLFLILGEKMLDVVERVLFIY